MKSRISIEVDFESEFKTNQPVIQIISRQSDDVRDKLLKHFLQKFHGSGLCKIEFKQRYEGSDDNFDRVFITPISLLFGMPDIDNKEQIQKFFETGEVRGVGMQRAAEPNVSLETFNQTGSLG